MIVHPAFNFGGRELTGIWVAKFEASNGGNSTVKVLPNKQSWRNITIGNAFKNCYNMKENNIYGLSTNANTHLMKNSEWGAVAYLSASQYGTIPKRNSNSSYYTGGNSTSGGYVTNKVQSTTGTVNGVYDLSGGAWECVAAYWDNGNTSLANGNGTGLTMFDSTNGYKLKNEHAAYWDKYDVYTNPSNSSDIDGSYGYSLKTEAGNILVAKAAYERVQLMKNKKGDAMYEVINTFSYYGWNRTKSAYGWLRADYDASGNVTSANDTKTADPDIYGIGYYGGDYILMGNDVLPFAVRGGYYESISYTGVFSFDGSSGRTFSTVGFRPVLTI